MLAAKQVADLITFSRALMGLSLAWIGLVYQAAGLPLAAWIMILDWTGDSSDHRAVLVRLGPLAGD